MPVSPKTNTMTSFKSQGKFARTREIKFGDGTKILGPDPIVIPSIQRLHEAESD